jgi:hypothetical protein
MEPAKPEGSPRWQGAVRAGDLLYIPRGWWYQDSELDEPSLYLAIRFTNPRGADIVSRLVSSLRMKESVRMDVPRFLTADHQSRYIAALQQEVGQAITLPGIFMGVLDDVQEASDPLVEFNLPWNVGTTPLPPSGDHQLILLKRFPSADLLLKRRGDGWIDILHNDRLVRFDEQAGCVLERLCKLPAPTLNTLLEDCRHRMAEKAILMHVSELLINGLLTARAPAVSGETGLGQRPAQELYSQIGLENEQ